jgi:hypothetical protein
MVAHAPRSVGPADFHDGHVLSVRQAGDEVRVTLQGSSGKRYEVYFQGVHSIESESPEGMVLYALREETEDPTSLTRYEFANWYCDEPADERSRAYLRITANRINITSTASDS